MNADTLRRLSGVSLAAALRIVLALSCLSSLIQARPRVHHSEEEPSSGEAGDGDEASHDLVVKLLLDLVNVLPSDKLSELDAVLTRGMMEMPQADDSGKVPEDEVDVQDQELKDKDPPPTPERDPYAREFLDPANSTAAPNVSAGYIETPRLPNIRERYVKDDFYFHGLVCGVWTISGKSFAEILSILTLRLHGTFHGIFAKFESQE